MRPLAASVVAFALLAAMAGCGGSSNQTGRTATLVALANKVCAELGSNRRAPLPPTDGEAKLIALLRGDHDLPGVRRLVADVDARKQLVEEMARLTGGRSAGTLPHGFEPVEAIDEAYRLDLRVYDDEKALGMTACARRPRAPIGE